MSARPILDILREHRRGETLDELSDKLHEAVAAVAETKKSATLTIKITLKPAGDTGAVSMLVDPGLKLPPTDAMESLYFVSPENNLTKISPQQILELPGAPTLVHKGIA